MKLIPLHSRKYLNHFAKVDNEDYDRINQYHWNVLYTHGIFYAICRQDRNGNYVGLMHNLILGVIGMDHVNHDGEDNQRCNLRPATTSQNAMNVIKHKDGTSDYKGVCWNKFHQKWIAQICLNRRVIHLGYFISVIEAALAYDCKARELFGNRANLNFPL